MSQSSGIKKTCVVCGLEKPFSAFLSLSGEGGTALYGNICAECRKANLNQLKTEQDDSTRVKTGGRIDSKTKVHEEITNQEKNQKKEISEKELKEKLETQQLNKTFKTEEKARLERTHRENYLKKSTFLHERTPEKLKTESTQQTLVNADKIEAQKTEEKQKGIDFTSPFQPSQTGGLIKFQSSEFNRFKAWLGGSAPIANNLNAATSLAAEKDKLAKKALKETKETKKPHKTTEKDVQQIIEHQFKPKRSR